MRTKCFFEGPSLHYVHNVLARVCSVLGQYKKCHQKTSSTGSVGVTPVVVPSPATMSCDFESSTSIFAAGCVTSICTTTLEHKNCKCQFLIADQLKFLSSTVKTFQGSPIPCNVNESIHHLSLCPTMCWMMSFAIFTRPQGIRIAGKEK